MASTSGEEDIKSLAKKPRLDETGEVDLMSIFGAEVVKIGTTSPVQDFLELLKSKKKTEEEVYAEMEKVIADLLGDSGGTNAALLAKTRDCIRVYRQRAVDAGNVSAFNRWMNRFKEHVISHYFQDFWRNHVVEAKLGLITKQDSDASGVTEDEAREFYSVNQPAEAGNQPEEDDEALVSLHSIMQSRRFRWRLLVKKKYDDAVVIPGEPRQHLPFPRLGVFSRNFRKRVVGPSKVAQVADISA